MLLQNKKRTQKCNKRNPEPPCNRGFEEVMKLNKKGDVTNCCYKIKKYTKQKTCNKRNPSPPCTNTMEIKEQTLADGTTLKCCYKKNNKIKNTKMPHVRKSLFAEHDSLMEFDPLGEVRHPDKQLVSKLSRYVNGLLVSSKFDGHRMLYDNALNEGLSRTGKTSFNIPQEWKNVLSISPMHLDGEIFLPGLPASQVAALRTNSTLSKKLWENVAEYHVFDLPTHAGVYTERIKEYTKIVENICNVWNANNHSKKCPIYAVGHTLLKTPEEIKENSSKLWEKNIIAQLI